MTKRYYFSHSNKKLSVLLASAMMMISTNVLSDTNNSPKDLYEQILELQNHMGIKVLGLERIQNEEKIATRGSLEKQIEQLLVTFNHVVIRNDKGEIERVVIVNKKQKSEIQTRRSEGAKNREVFFK